jgi:hypothetical protein
MFKFEVWDFVFKSKSCYYLLLDVVLCSNNLFCVLTKRLFQLFSVHQFHFYDESVERRFGEISMADVLY